MPGVGTAGGDWRQRARRAEAEAAVARTELVAMSMQAEAKVNEVTRSLSWRLTDPLRRLNALRKARGSA
jgi:hypothetical protein